MSKNERHLYSPVAAGEEVERRAEGEEQLEHLRFILHRRGG